VTVVLYGATGYTGRLVTGELRRRGLDFVLAGRNEERLARVSSEHGGGAPTRTASAPPSSTSSTWPSWAAC
jgi:short subunit dehydrogenase-like uncharacterized protein